MAQKPQTRPIAPRDENGSPAAGNTDAGGIFVDQQDATDLAPREFAAGNPTGFLENLGATYDATMRSGLTVSKARSRSLAYAPIMDALNGGVSHSDRLTNPWEGASRGNIGRIRAREGTLGIDFSGGWAGVTAEEQERTVWAEIERRRRTDPGFLPGVPRNRDELNAKVDEDDRKALDADDAIAARATVWGTAGGFVGGVGASFRDPLNIASLPLGAGAARTILGAAIREGAINAGVTAISQAPIAARNRELGREYGLDEAVTSTLYAGIGGVVLGAGAKGLEVGAKKLGNRIARAHMQRITAVAESRNRDVDAAGNVITSSAGAKGRMQVMDGTNLDPGFGVKPARDNSLGERARVGRDYLDAMMRRYKNDPRKAWAAYNWGPGKLDDALEAHGARWFDHAPPETRKYVTQNLKALGRDIGHFGNWMGDVEAEPVFPPATADQVAAAITLEGLDDIQRTSPMPASVANDTRHLENLQGHVDALEEGAPAPATRVDPIELKRPSAATLDSYDPLELVVDARRFQFKGNSDDAGVTDRLAGVKEWSPILSGKAVVWLDEAGKPHVADGHQRVGLAKRLTGENPAAGIRIDAVTLRAEDGITAEMARTWAALKNIAEGSGTAVDAAKVLRTTGDNTPLPLPPRSALVRDARSLSALSDDAFGMVVNELVPPEFAAMVGRLAPGAPELHAAYLQLLHRLAPANMTQAESVVRQAIAAGATRETQLGLFGEEIVSRSLYLERARVLDNSLRRLKNDKRVFRTLIDARDDIERAGNALATDANAAKVENNAQALEILTRLAHRTGPVSDALGRAAAELGAGRSARAAVDSFIRELEELDLSELARGVERSAGDGNVPGGDGRAIGAGEPDGGVDGSAGGTGVDDAGAAGGADNGLGEPTGFDLFGDPVYATRELDDLDAGDVLTAAADDAQGGLQLDAFADPHAGAGAAAQTELLAHDVRMIAEAQATPSIRLVHGSSRADFTLDSIRIEPREGTKQGRKYGGFYASDEADVIHAEGYAAMGAAGDAGQVYNVDLKPGAIVESYAGDITRLSMQEIKAYRARGVDVLRGKDLRGRTENAIISKDAIASVAPREPRADTAAARGSANQEVASRPSSQESLAGSTNGSEPRSSSGSAGKSSAEGGAANLTQPLPRADSPRVPASDETTRAGFPAQRTNEAIISPPDERAAPRGALGLDLMDGESNPAIGARRAEMVRLRGEAPLRAGTEQADVDGLALFDRARSPELFAIGESVDVDGKAAPELRTADDLLAELDADDAAIAAIERCLV